MLPAGAARWTSVLAIALAAVASAAPVHAAAPALSLSGTPRLTPGKTAGEFHVLLKAEHFGGDTMPRDAAASVMDLGTLDAVATKVEFDARGTLVYSDASGRAWRWRAKVTSLPLNSTQKRFARLKFGSVQQFVEYTLTNAAAGTFTWSVTAPTTPWIVWQGVAEARDETTLLIVTGEWPATNVRLTHAVLRDVSSLSSIELKDLGLCDAAGRCDTISIPPRTTATLTLRLKPSTEVMPWFHGKYGGTLGITADERIDPQVLTLAVHASSWVAKILGVALLALGVALWWWANVWARSRLLRLEALRPVAALRGQVTALLAELGEPPDPSVDAADVKKKLAEIAEALTTEKLDEANLLPPPPPRLGGADTSAALATALAEKASRVAGLTIIVRDGIHRLWRDWNESGEATKLKKHVKTLDAEGAKVTSEADARKVVDEAIVAYRAKEPEPEAFRDADTRARPLIMQAVTWEIGRLHKRAWLLWGTLTILAGAATLVFANAGFGSVFDFLFCFFWGFGLPTTLEKLQQVTPGTIATSAGVSLPRTG